MSVWIDYKQVFYVIFLKISIFFFLNFRYIFVHLYQKIKYVISKWTLKMCLGKNYSTLCLRLWHFTPFFFLIEKHVNIDLPLHWNVSIQWVPCTIHEIYKSIFSIIFSLKMSPTILFIHLKFILLQCFPFQQNKQYPDGS